MLKGQFRFSATDYTHDYFQELHEGYLKGIKDAKISLVTSFCGDVENRKVLDAGCGTGVLSAHLLEKGATVISVDFSASALTIFKKAMTSRCLPANILQTDVTCLPFDNNAFDIILATDLIEHLHRPQEFLNEVHRVLKKRGRLLLTTDNAWFTIINGLSAKSQAVLNQLKQLNLKSAYWNFLAKTKYFSLLEDSRHVQIYSPLDLTRILKRTGFVIEKFDSYFFNVYPRHNLQKLMSISFSPLRVVFKPFRQYMLFASQKVH